MKKAELIEWAARLPDDEEVFPLRSQDIFAARLVNDWINLAQSAGVNIGKTADAATCMLAMLHWPNKKVPD